MKKLPYASILIFCFSIFNFAQTSNLPCPQITVLGPSGLVSAGETITFSATVKGKTPDSNLEFEWTVSQGTIIDQQGKPEIRVTTTEEMAGSNLTATVKIKGISDSCNNKASETAVMEQLIEGQPVDSYGKVSLNTERERLDNFFVALQNDINSKGYIYFGIDKNEELKTVKNRLQKVMKHFDMREINRNSIIFDVCYSYESRTVLRVVPDGAKLPDYGECERVDIDLK